MARTTWSQVTTLSSGQFILTTGNHFVALRTQGGCLEINRSNRTHEWHTACIGRTKTPLAFSDDLGRWVIDPDACRGVFIVQDGSETCKYSGL